MSLYADRVCRLPKPRQEVSMPIAHVDDPFTTIKRVVLRTKYGLLNVMLALSSIETPSFSSIMP